MCRDSKQYKRMILKKEKKTVLYIILSVPLDVLFGDPSSSVFKKRGPFFFLWTRPLCF